MARVGCEQAGCITGERSELAALDAALCANRAWDGKAFWKSVRPWLRARRAARPAPLPPLFKLHDPDF